MPCSFDNSQAQYIQKINKIDKKIFLPGPKMVNLNIPNFIAHHNINASQIKFFPSPPFPSENEGKKKLI